MISGRRFSEQMNVRPGDVLRDALYEPARSILPRAKAIRTHSIGINHQYKWTSDAVCYCEIWRNDKDCFRGNYDSRRVAKHRALSSESDAGSFFFSPAHVGETLRGCAATADRIGFGCVGPESERNVPLKEHESNNLQSGRRERMNARPPTVSPCETAKDENNRGEKQPRAHKRTC